MGKNHKFGTQSKILSVLWDTPPCGGQKLEHERKPTWRSNPEASYLWVVNTDNIMLSNVGVKSVKQRINDPRTISPELNDIEPVMRKLYQTSVASSNKWNRRNTSEDHIQWRDNKWMDLLWPLYSLSQWQPVWLASIHEERLMQLRRWLNIDQQAGKLETRLYPVDSP